MLFPGDNNSSSVYISNGQAVAPASVNTTLIAGSLDFNESLMVAAGAPAAPVLTLSKTKGINIKSRLNWIGELSMLTGIGKH